MGFAQREGISLPIANVLIAATARYHDLIVATRNACDFKRMDIDMFNPWELSNPPTNGTSDAS